MVKIPVVSSGVSAHVVSKKNKNMVKISNTIPIEWFGNRKEYNQSDIRIVTVGLNPSDREFEDPNTGTCNTQYRFPSAVVGVPATYPQARNEYFTHNPYDWFNNLERVLQGAEASYGGLMPKRIGGVDQPHRRAIHTDLCSSEATLPAWSQLPSATKRAIAQVGIPRWENLMKELQPDIIIMSVAEEYWSKLPITNISNLCKITKTQNGTKRKRPVVIRKGYYNGALVILGVTRNTPFGSVCKEEQKHIGKLILQAFYKMKGKQQPYNKI